MRPTESACTNVTALRTTRSLMFFAQPCQFCFDTPEKICIMAVRVAELFEQLNLASKDDFFFLDYRRRFLRVIFH